ncbi:MAG TPA: WD40 repeat domain-containing protein [Xenococcaceae cyanobacterium]
MRKIFYQKQFERRELSTDVALSPNGRHLAVSYTTFLLGDEPGIIMFPTIQFPSGFFGPVRFWDIKNGIRFASIRAHLTSTDSITFSPDGKWLATVRDERRNNKIKLWRLPVYSLESRLWIIAVLAGVGYWQRKRLLNWIDN